ncbi:hypothetical protein ACH5RR_001615 [Cinchona calisaya]|uniref:DUF3511 domain-containing protein n=1 Tax=Cinchona calisaya TaxID=153742 RepID=A0ABD3B556_9GENT
MAEFTANHRRTGQTLGIINGKAYGATNIYVARSNNNKFANQAVENYHVTKPYHTTPPPPSQPTSSTPWIDYRQLKRRKRIAKYKLYAYEGKVKNSLKKGFRWIKRTCRKIVHGF